MAAFPSLTMSTDQQISCLLTVMMVRCLFEELGSFDDPRMPAALADAVFVFSMGKGASSAATCRQICQSMKINVFSTDATTCLIRKCVEGVSRYHATANAYILARCTSREFAQEFYTGGAYIDRKTVRAKLVHTLNRLGKKYWRCFTTSFNPQRRERRQFFKLRRRPRLSRRELFRTMSLKNMPRLKLKQGKAWRSKVDICREIRSYPGMGPLSAKNMWQFFSLSGLRLPRKQDNQFGEVGEGGRKGCNLMLHNPLQFATKSTDDHSAQFFHKSVQELQHRMLKHALLRDSDFGEQFMKTARQKVKLELATIEGAQFLLCEWSKLCNWMLTGNCTYCRGYWRLAETNNTWDESDAEEIIE